MIIYFSGTGNSQYVANMLLEEDEKLVSLAEHMKSKDYIIELTNDEKLGLVFPVYFYTIPSIVKEFLERVEIKNAGYVYSVITCGGGTGQASAVLKRVLANKGIRLYYFMELVMPDNSMLFYQIPSVEAAQGILDAAKTEIDGIKRDLTERKTTHIGDNVVLSNLMNLGYKLCSGTKKFYAEESCIGCGLCEQNCPEQVIKLENNRPVWNKANCCKCSACINRCPEKAIQYGKVTKNRNRYVNPLV